MAEAFGDINLPGASFGTQEQEPEAREVVVDDAPVEEDPRETEYVFDRAYFEEGPAGFGFNRTCFVVVEGSFRCETVRTRS